MAKKHTHWAGPLFDGHRCSLGYGIVDWLTAYACHGPGDVEGEPLDFSTDPELEDFIIRAYELDPVTGRRKVKRGVYSAPKGRSKSEAAGLIGVAEALAEVRFDGWDAGGQPVAAPVRSPFIRALATEEKQAGNTFQNIAFVMGEWGQDSHPEVYGGIRGIRDYRSASNIYLPGGGECRSSSSGAASKDGGKETYLVPDEVHLYVLPELRDMYATSMRNLGKRKAADPWALLTTTACRLGERSVWEVIEEQWRKGLLGDEWLIHHVEARGKIDIYDRDRTLRQLRQVYGSAMDPETGWMNAEDVYGLMLDPSVCPDEQTAARYYLNRSMSGSNAWIAKAVVTRQTRHEVVAPGTAITLGFDGSLNDDSTVLRGCRLSDGYRFTIGMWERPPGVGIWEVPRRDVLTVIREAHADYDVIRGYYDPHEWRTDIATLVDYVDETYGKVQLAGEKEPQQRVVPFPTSAEVAMGRALDRLHTDLVNGETFHDDDKRAHVHYGNAYVRMKGQNRLVRKDTPNSARKIDTVVTDALAYQARADVLELGWTPEPARTTRKVVHLTR